MTKGHIKEGQGWGRRLSTCCGQSWPIRTTSKQWHCLLSSKAFKGKRQLSWSNGLKARFGLAEKNDEELAAELEDNAELLGLLTPDQWRDVLKVKARATVLELAASAGWPAVQKFLTFIDGCRDGVYQYDDSMVAEARLLIMEGMT